MLKRIISILLTVVTLVGVLNAEMYSVNAAVADTQYSEYKFSGGQTVAKAMATIISDALSSFKTEVNVVQYNMTYKEKKAPGETDDMSEFCRMAYYEFPLLFQLKKVYCTYSTATDGTRKIINFRFEYKYDKNEYNKRKAECLIEVNKLLDGIKGEEGKGLDDITKALLIHDRIIEHCEYDRTSPILEGSDSLDMYGTLVKGLAVCQGYTRAYIYLLRELGIDSYSCQSDSLNHVWNVVWIKGKRYHVDVTNDDPVYDVIGRADHRYFLRSTGFLAKDELFFNHKNAQSKKVNGKYDYQYTASNVTDTTYDGWNYWHNSTSVFQRTDSGVFYIYRNDGPSSDTGDDKYELKKIGSSTVLRTLPQNSWKAGKDGGYWSGNFSRLASDGKNLFYSVHDKIYLYNPSGADKNVSAGTAIEKKYNDNKSKVYSIIGFTYKDGYLICDFYGRPVYESTLTYSQYKSIRSSYRASHSYDKTVPTVSISTSGDVAAYHTVTLKMSDNVKISGYYWGKNSEYTKNKFVSTSATSAKVYVSDSGTYYFRAVDTSGNLSSQVSKVFAKIKLYTMGGKSPVTNLVIPKGNSYTLPTATRNGYKFNGWSKKDDGSSPFKTATAGSDTTFYASWTKTSSSAQSYPGWSNPFNDVKSGWYYNAVAYCAQRGFMNGMTESAFSPGSAIKREQFAQILANISGIDTDKYKYVDSGFSDVKTGQWYSGAIAWGVSWGYISGMSSTKFGLGQNITREQIAQLLYVYGKAHGKVAKVTPDGLSEFTDRSKVGAWALDAVKWAVGAGIINGVGGPIISPKSNATRAQAAQMIMQYDSV